ncbi:hypothetical protein WH47_03104 [Habropoda laboriosa]|uniref:Uncharacterized protein n=1 Tax=Habropoda laboriosa TaxID=597456 RepID=A0A0L7QWA6_9HYME|nr:hypothetical protein WH47_03104 [Habropoda laboriosa]
MAIQAQGETPNIPNKPPNLSACHDGLEVVHQKLKVQQPALVNRKGPNTVSFSWPSGGQGHPLMPAGRAKGKVAGIYRAVSDDVFLKIVEDNYPEAILLSYVVRMCNSDDRRLLVIRSHVAIGCHRINCLEEDMRKFKGGKQPYTCVALTVGRLKVRQPGRKAKPSHV